jgi:hypothetical protein
VACPRQIVRSDPGGWGGHACDAERVPSPSVVTVSDVPAVSRGACFVLRMAAGSQAQQGHLVDALAPGGDEGRGTLRKAAGRCEQSLIRGCPNGATHPSGYPVLNP